MRLQTGGCGFKLFEPRTCVAIFLPDAHKGLCVLDQKNRDGVSDACP